MKHIKKVISLLLVLCLFFCLAPASVSAETNEAGGSPANVSSQDLEGAGNNETKSAGTFYRIFSLDCGRRYFSVEQIEGIIDQLAANDYTHLQLIVGNEGMRFLLNDMNVTVNGTDYTTNQIVNAIQKGNDSYDNSKSYTPGNTEELTESDMDTIISYANKKGISIIPFINTPGHMTVLNSVMNTLGISDVTGNNMSISDSSQSTFVKALLQKYISYFSSKGCGFFNLGADEYSFSSLDRTGYSAFVSYINDLATMVTSAGLVPVAFNDGIYYKSDDSDFKAIADDINKNIVIAYWCQADNYASAAALANNGFKLLNNNDQWYYVYGDALHNHWIQGQWGYNDSKAALQNTSCTTFDTKDSTGVTAAGSVLCLWCDYPGEAEYTQDIQNEVYDLIGTMAAGNPTYFNISDSDENEPTEPAEEKTINLTVGGQEVVVVSGDVSGNYDTEDTSIATVTAAAGVSEEKPAVPESYDKVSSITSDSEYVIGDGTHWMVLNGSSLTYTTDYSKATKWVVTSSDSGYTIKSGSYYLYCSNNGNLSVSSSSRNWTYNSATGFYYKRNRNTYYLRWNGSNGWAATNKNSNNAAPYTYTPAQEAIPGETITTLTFAGVAEGTTTVTIGNVKYTLNVTKEDLTGVTDLPIQLWITNAPITVNGVTNQTTEQFNAHDNGGYAQYLTVEAEDAYGINGVELASLVPTGVKDDNNVTTSNDTAAKYVLWKGTVLNTSTGLQEVWGDNMCNSGSDYTYVRYYDGAWAVSSDRESWTIVTGSGSTGSYSACSEQIIAYYMQRTEITEQVITDTVDYGDILSDKDSTDSNYVILDYAVKYGNGTQIPDTFRQDGKTLYYHCNGGGDTGVFGEYRRLNAIRATETSSYEVYMITITPTADSTGTKTFTALTVPTEYSYAGKERVIWAESADVIPDGYATVADDDYTDNQNFGEVTYGGDPTLSELNIYNRQGMLVTYYIRGKQTEDSLQVKYVDDATGETFYTTNIPVVNSGDESKNFNNNLLYGEGSVYTVPGNTTLEDNTYYVVDTYNTSVYIRSDLTKIVDLKGVYSTGIYTQVKAEVDANDPKVLILHYTSDTSKTTKNFIVDFGLPVTVAADQLFANTSDIKELVKVSDGSFGTVACSGTSFTYTPDRVLTASDVVSLKVVYSDASTSTSTINVGFIPATTVYYEEGFADMTDFDGGSKGSGTQTASVAGDQAHYGYDEKYTVEYENSTGANGPSNKSEAVSAKKGASATLDFTGTGIDIYANCEENTGNVMILVTDKTTNKAVKLLTVKTAAVGVYGDTTNNEAHGMAIASISGLTYGNYNIKITTTSDASVNLDGYRIYNTLNNTADSIYKQDLEEKPEFIELRDQVLAALEITADDSEDYGEQIKDNILSQVYATGAKAGAVVISKTDAGEIDDHKAQELLDDGPKNELFLYKNQSVVFTVKTDRMIQVGMRAVNQSTSYTLNGKNGNITSSTDMFYEVGQGSEDGTTVTITNTGDGILSVTKLKICDDPEVALGLLTEEDLTDALVSLGIIEETIDSKPEPTYADASLTVQVNNATTVLTKNGIEGEIATFSADEIKTAAESLVAEGYNLDNAAYTDVEVSYGQSDTVTFTALENEVEPVNIFKQIINSVKNIFGKIFDRR